MLTLLERFQLLLLNHFADQLMNLQSGTFVRKEKVNTVVNTA